MASSCTVALASNYSTRIANMDADISKRMNVYTTFKAYKMAAYYSKYSLASALYAIDTKYDQGRFIQKSYPGIPPAALYDNGINENFWKNNVVVDGTIKQCLGVSTCHYCEHAEFREKACCACGKESNCTLGLC